MQLQVELTVSFSNDTAVTATSMACPSKCLSIDCKHRHGLGSETLMWAQKQQLASGEEDRRQNHSCFLAFMLQRPFLAAKN
eukprot:1156993-Pelagomonas_calceolata.AAC.7